MPDAAGLYYELHGPTDAPPLILSSGLGGSAGYWAPNLAAFAARFRTIVYDHRGTGRSDRAPLADLSVEDMAADVLMLLDHLGIETAHVVGHALGGLIGLSLALAAPARLGRLVVVNGWARLEPHTARCFDARLALLRDTGVEAFVRAQPIFLYPANWLTTQADRYAAEEAAAIAHFPGVATIKQRIAAVRAFDAEDRLGDIRTPVLVWSASDDVLVPSLASTKLARGLGMVATPAGGRSGGHACNVTEPEDFNRVVPAWLAGDRLLED